MIQPRTLGACAGASTAQEFHFGDFTLDQTSYRLQRGESVLRLEKRPMELLILLVQRRGELVSRDEIAERLWGKDVFLDVDNGINTAIRKVRTVLRDDPERPRFVETVVGKGYRFAAPVICNNRDSNMPAQTLASPDRSTPGPAVPPPLVLKKSQEKAASIRLPILLGAVGLVAMFTIAWLLGHNEGAKGTNPAAIRSLAVLPLKNLSGDPAQEYFADGMTEEIIGRLSTIHGLRVISRTTSMHFKDTRMSVPEIAKALNIDGIVEGSVVREGGRVRIHAQLIRAATDEHFWSQTYDRNLEDALALQSEVAQAIAQKVEVTVTGEERVRLVAARRVAPEVYESYLKGQDILAKGAVRSDIEKSIAHFEDAIRKDASFAPAYVGLASAYEGLGLVFVGAHPGEARSQAVSAARKAIELDPNLPEAHTLLASTHATQWRWADAEAEYKRALELNPNDAAAHLGLARWFLCHGRLDEAQSWSLRARALDPIGVTGTDIGWILFQSRQYAEAIRELRSEIAVHPDDAMSHWFLGFALSGNGQNAEAIPVLKETLALSAGSPAVLGVLARAYARAGDRTQALGLIEELRRRQQKAYVPPAAFVNAYLGLDDREQAFVWLERAYQEKSNILQWIKVHPFFDSIRDDPRFKDILRRVGLDQ